METSNRKAERLRSARRWRVFLHPVWRPPISMCRQCLSTTYFRSSFNGVLLSIQLLSSNISDGKSSLRTCSRIFSPSTKTAEAGRAHFQGSLDGAILVALQTFLYRLSRSHADALTIRLYYEASLAQNPALSLVSTEFQSTATRVMTGLRKVATELLWRHPP